MLQEYPVCTGVLYSGHLRAFRTYILQTTFRYVTREHLALACDALVDECLEARSTDNLTVQVVWMENAAPAAASTSGVAGVTRALFVN